MSLLFWMLVLVLQFGLVAKIVAPFIQNYRRAKATKLPFIIVPYYSRLVSIFVSRTVFKLMDKNFPLIERNPTHWRNVVTSVWPWKFRYKTFEILGSDTFLTVAPGGITLHTADADVIAQIMSRGDDFPKATHLYKHIGLFGKNVVSSSGAEWRRHRSVASPAFTDKNNRLVWEETIDVTKGFLATWTESDVHGNAKTTRELGEDSMRMSLEVIGRAALGQKLDWSKQPTSLPNGHSMSFTKAVQTLLSNMIAIMALPRWLLKRGPFKRLNNAYQAYIEMGQYMEGMISEKDVPSQDDSPTVDLISALINRQKTDKYKRGIEFTDSDVMGNLFIFIIAGHETSANSIHFCLLLLALHPEDQLKVQAELSEIFQGRPPSRWDFEKDMSRLLNSYLAVVINEQLRLFSPAITIPKVVSPEPQSLSINGQTVVIPGNTMVKLSVACVHRNPKCWPTLSPNDLEEFKPSRWILNGSGSSYVPPKGAFIPFSDGQRACLGKRFAQVEILAALAVILTSHSVELAVDDFATEAEIERMNVEERREIWEKAKEKGWWTMQTKMSSMITLQLRGGDHVPVKFVERGKERFNRTGD